MDVMYDGKLAKVFKIKSLEEITVKETVSGVLRMATHSELGSVMVVEGRFGKKYSKAKMGKNSNPDGKK